MPAYVRVCDACLKEWPYRCPYDHAKRIKRTPYRRSACDCEIVLSGSRWRTPPAASWDPNSWNFAGRHNFHWGPKMLHRVIAACSVLALFAGLSAGLAKADSLDATSPAIVSSGEYDFTYVVGSNTYAWSIPEPVMAMNVVPGASFNFDGIPFTLNQGPNMLGDVEFFSATFSGGFALATYPPAPGQTYFANTGGPVLYTGPESSPTFDLGTFTVDDVTAGTTGALTITQVAATATPEPSTLLLTGLGLVALFWVARKRNFVTPA